MKCHVVPRLGDKRESGQPNIKVYNTATTCPSVSPLKFSLENKGCPQQLFSQK